MMPMFTGVADHSYDRQVRLFGCAVLAEAKISPIQRLWAPTQGYVAEIAVGGSERRKKRSPVHFGDARASLVLRLPLNPSFISRQTHPLKMVHRIFCPFSTLIFIKKSA
jgi:hypothetical protein